MASDRVALLVSTERFDNPGLAGTRLPRFDVEGLGRVLGDPEIGGFDVRTLVVWGADDRLVPLAYGEAWARSIPGARLVTLDRCGHLPPLEQPERFAEVALGFLDA